MSGLSIDHSPATADVVAVLMSGSQLLTGQFTGARNPQWRPRSSFQARPLDLSDLVMPLKDQVASPRRGQIAEESAHDVHFGLEFSKRLKGDLADSTSSWATHPVRSGVGWLTDLWRIG